MITDNSIANIKIEDVKIHGANFNVHSRRWMGNILFVTDMVSLVIAILAAMHVHHSLPASFNSAYIGIFLIYGVTIAYLFLRRGLYPPVGMHYADELRNLVSTTTLAFLIMIGVTFAFKTTATYSRLELVLTWILSLPVIPFCRYVVRRLLINLHLWGESVLVVGDPQKARILANYFKARLQYGILPVAVLSDRHRLGDPMAPCPRLPVCTVKLFARKLSVKTAVIVLDDFNDFDQIVKLYRDTFQWVILIKDNYRNYGLTFLKPLDFLDVLGLQVKNNLLSHSAQILKRMMDIVLSFLGLLILAPLLTVLALLINWESHGGVFYRQGRLGKNGQVFHLYKFRTMYQNAAEILKEELVSNLALKKEWDTYQKLRDDPRITKAGKLLRRFSLDELPQLWNVLRGDMSLVGPRPIMVNQLEIYGATIKEFFEVRPGITGLWQVSGRNQTTFERRAELDLEYIQRWSVWLDIYILLKTIKVVVWQQGAY
jgi:Undecaprenyl-phosphate galactose phosphotransferase WbaP